MSSRDENGRNSGLARRRVLALLGAGLLGAPVLAACQPLYGTTTGGAQLKDVMASVEIATIPGRVGQRVRNELIFATTRGGYAAEPLYRLNIVVRESENDLLVRQTGDARGRMFRLDADFELIQLSDNNVVFKGRSSARAAFDRFDPIFTNLRAKIDAENRAASSVADGIRTRVAAFLSNAA